LGPFTIQRAARKVPNLHGAIAPLSIRRKGHGGEKEIITAEVLEIGRKNGSQRNAAKETRHLEIGPGRQSWHGEKPHASDRYRIVGSAKEGRARAEEEGGVAGGWLVSQPFTDQEERSERKFGWTP
jgi:hypothetical protein